MAEKTTVRTVTYNLMRSLGLTTVFGNPGSTEETFLQEFPADFSYVLALQEASAIAMADAFAQVTDGRPWSTCTPRRAWVTPWATWSRPTTEIPP